MRPERSLAADNVTQASEIMDEHTDDIEMAANKQAPNRYLTMETFANEVKRQIKRNRPPADSFLAFDASDKNMMRLIIDTYRFVIYKRADKKAMNQTFKGYQRLVNMQSVAMNTPIEDPEFLEMIDQAVNGRYKPSIKGRPPKPDDCGAYLYEINEGLATPFVVNGERMPTAIDSENYHPGIGKEQPIKRGEGVVTIPLKDDDIPQDHEEQVGGERNDRTQRSISEMVSAASGGDSRYNRPKRDLKALRASYERQEEEATYQELLKRQTKAEHTDTQGKSGIGSTGSMAR